MSSDPAAPSQTALAPATLPRKVLVANRGEIAVRILRTLREMAIPSVAVYSPVDRAAPHVLEADEAMSLPGDPPSESYLNVAALLQAAERTGADAVHPGYGFLSEQADFAEAVEAHGLTFIGPPGPIIRQLGDKTAARTLARSVGVPVVPGLDTSESNPERLNGVAHEVGFPLIVKAAAGGGGKGMRVVHTQEALREALDLAQREAQAAFGDGALYLERYLAGARHVEIQVLADAHGHAIHLGERECSIQRRHQKILEESPCPAPSFDAALRQRMGEAALSLMRAAGYVNAGTVEFLLDPDGHFYFLEVNTRLQVEHPITELTYGLDLVRAQVEIAAGAPLRLRQEDLAPRGHAIECRLYAEDPTAGFLPSAGTIALHLPPGGPFVRFDGGIATGVEVPVHYDPILGKLVVWGEDRPAAIARLDRALRETVVLGVPTATELLLDLLALPAFRAGETHTTFLEDLLTDWAPSLHGDEEAAIAFALADLVGLSTPTAPSGAPGATGHQDAIPSPWQTLRGFDSARG